jgi:hypothetical protein
MRCRTIAVRSKIFFGLLRLPESFGPSPFRTNLSRCTIRMRARVIKALQTKGLTLSRLARARLDLDGQAFVIFDGQELRVCRMLRRAIAAVVRARR